MSSVFANSIYDIKTEPKKNTVNFMFYIIFKIYKGSVLFNNITYKSNERCAQILSDFCFVDLLVFFGRLKEIITKINEKIISINGCGVVCGGAGVVVT